MISLDVEFSGAAAMKPVVLEGYLKTPRVFFLSWRISFQSSSLLKRRGFTFSLQFLAEY